MLPPTSKVVTVVVVRPNTFAAYVSTWGGDHAILQLPASIEYDSHGKYTPDSGGIGYARLAIQLLADAWGLPWIYFGPFSPVYQQPPPSFPR